MVRVFAVAVAMSWCGIVATAQDSREAWIEFESETFVFAEPPAQVMQQYTDAFWERYWRFDEAVQNDPALLDEVLTSLEADKHLLAAAESPEWLHGMDLVISGHRLDLLEPVEGEENQALDHPLIRIWIVGWDGLILHSGNEGVDFRTQASGTKSDLQAVDFVDEMHGFVAGKRGSVLKTTDGGKSWTTLNRMLTLGARAPDNHFGIDCISRYDCWLSGDYPYIQMSEDAGATWSKSSEFEGEALVAALLRITPEEGLAAGSRGVWRTQNSGNDWSLVHSITANSSSGIRSIDSADGKVIWAVGEEDGGLGIIKSEDSGRTWRSQSANVFYQDLSGEVAEFAKSLRGHAVSAVSSEKAFVSGANGLILGTVDGGAHWWVLRVTDNPTDSFYAMAMRDARVGWAAGNYGNVMGTNSGGRLWTRLRGYLRDRYLFSFEAFEELTAQ